MDTIEHSDYVPLLSDINATPNFVRKADKYRSIDEPAATHATIIEVSARDEMMFAYFPTRPEDIGYRLKRRDGIYMYRLKSGNAINE
jgi:hypothetical protein